MKKIDVKFRPRFPNRKIANCVLACGLIFFGSLSQAVSRIEIETDENDCVDGWLSMDMKIKVDGEEFRFSPSCSFSFNDSFKTAKGVECRIDAGMCSAFFPKNKVEVSCDGYQESKSIRCTKE